MTQDLKIKTAAGKPSLNLVPLRALKGAARVFTYGGKKYQIGNYLKAAMADGAGGRYIGAELRHMADLQGLDGQFTPESLAIRDEESGLPHIDHMLCGLIMLRAIMIKDGVLDEDPGEGREPPSARAASESKKSIQEILAEVRVSNGEYDVPPPAGRPFEGEFGHVFAGREVDDYSARDAERGDDRCCDPFSTPGAV